MTVCSAAYLVTPSPKPPQPVFTIRIFEPSEIGLWSADITNGVGKQLASASAPDFWAVWAMLEAAMRREMRFHEDLEDSE